MKRLIEIAESITNVARLRRAVISGRRRNFQPRFERIDIRPVEIKGKVKLQLISHGERSPLTTNIDVADFDLTTLMDQGYANLLVELDTEVIQARFTKKGELLIHREPREKSVETSLAHDRKKKRMLDPSDPVFISLGISDSDGRLIPRKSDKFYQVDSFLRTIDSVRANLDSQKSIRVVDLGCGSAYLTFAAQRYLTTLGKSVLVVGVDSREDSRIKNEQVARALGTDIEFRSSEIANYRVEPSDLVIALHACDTATDDALAWAVKSQAKVILAAPCCHHELNRTLKAASEPWQMILQDGIMKERFADLLTDSLRAQILRVLGYRTDIIEFVSDQHTPRNLMIRAVRTDAPDRTQDISALIEFCEIWQIKPKLVDLLQELLPKQVVEGLG